MTDTALHHVVVGSRNPVKSAAVREGFQRFFGGARPAVEGVAVPSGVAAQPMGDTETRRGAIQRALGARAARPQADFWVGIEGGVQVIAEDWYAMAWVAVLGPGEQWGYARSGAFLLPPAVAALLAQGYELGVADDRVFGQHNSKQKMGAVGLLTQGATDRTALYAHTVVLALAPFGPAWAAASGEDAGGIKGLKG